MIKAADNGSLLREAHLHQFIDLTKEIRNDITVEVETDSSCKVALGESTLLPNTIFLLFSSYPTLFLLW